MRGKLRILAGILPTLLTEAWDALQRCDYTAWFSLTQVAYGRQMG